MNFESVRNYSIALVIYAFLAFLFGVYLYFKGTINPAVSSIDLAIFGFIMDATEYSALTLSGVYLLVKTFGPSTLFARKGFLETIGTVGLIIASARIFGDVFELLPFSQSLPALFQISFLPIPSFNIYVYIFYTLVLASFFIGYWYLDQYIVESYPKLIPEYRGWEIYIMLMIGFVDMIIPNLDRWLKYITAPTIPLPPTSAIMAIFILVILGIYTWKLVKGTGTEETPNPQITVPKPNPPTGV